MYYSDDARRFNVLSGLISGAVVGAALTLLRGVQQEGVPGSGRTRARVRR